MELIPILALFLEGKSAKIEDIMPPKDLKKRALEEVSRARDLKKLEAIYKKYLGKKGELTQVLRSLKNLPERERKKRGELANQLKQALERAIKRQGKKFQVSGVEVQEKWLDVTLPGRRPRVGHLHPLTKVRQATEEIFQSMGFSVVEGPEIETEYYNFDALNIPPEHPARDMWDTFWLRQNESKNQKAKIKKSDKLLLRTHTSPMQVRYMEKNNPPLRIIVPGRCFRHEATDASHEMQFYQLEGLMVDREVSAANFKAVIKEFFRLFFKKETAIRLRPSFFPFTEPSFEVDMSCLNCGGRGCSACSRGGWMEMMGAGMVHPNVFKAAGYSPRQWQGFAFGMGLDRLAMMKYKIDDIRLFYSGDLRFLKQF